MNELFDSGEKKPRNRRWIYLTAAMVVLGLFLLLPAPQTVRLALIVSADIPVEMELDIPENCRLEGIYLRGNEKVPRSGKLFVLDINGTKIPVSDFSRLGGFKAKQEQGFENRAIEADWTFLNNVKSLTVKCEEISPEIKRYDLEVVFEVSGPQETVMEWNKYVRLKGQ